MTTTTDCLTNADGFTDDDVVARELALQGTPRPYDEIISDVRKAYRRGDVEYRVSDEPPGGTDEGPAIKRALEKVFTTSQVQCGINPGFWRQLLIVVQFPPRI